MNHLLQKAKHPLNQQANRMSGKEHSLVIVSISDAGYWGVCRKCQAKVWVSAQEHSSATSRTRCSRIKGARKQRLTN